MRSTQSNNCAIETHDSSMSQRIGEKITATDQRSTVSAPRLSRSGFTLLEVMIVVVILGILAALVVPKIISRPDEARVIAAKQDIASFMQALKLYRLDNLRYPTTEQGLQALVQKPVAMPLPPNWKTGGYIERLPKDPWGNAYQYLNPGLHGEIDVFSLGADGAAGGEGNDADIGSWTL
jgi:general secretion pathway protein G